MAEPLDDLPSLSALQDKIALAKPHKKKGESAGTEYSKDMSIAVQLLVELMVGVGLGAGLGYYIDRWLATSPIFLILFLLLGTAAGAKNMMKTDKQRKTDNTEVNKEDTKS